MVVDAEIPRMFKKRPKQCLITVIKKDNSSIYAAEKGRSRRNYPIAVHRGEDRKPGIEDTQRTESCDEDSEDGKTDN
jgi:hypothetical protein